METPEFDFNDAAQVTFDNISPALQEKFSTEDIMEILLVQDDYFETLDLGDEDDETLDDEIVVDHDEMKEFMLKACADIDISITSEELEEILNGEFIYLEQQGLVD